MQHRPNQLSGGERQRTAIARAIAGAPAIVFADEPTGNLDSRTGAEIVALLRALNSGGSTLVVITHDTDVAQSFPRQVHMRDGAIVHDSGALQAGRRMSAGAALPPSRLLPRDVLGVGSIGLRTRRLRAALSAVGVAIGIASMVAVLGISASSQADLLSTIDRLGTNLLTVQAGESFFGDDTARAEDRRGQAALHGRRAGRDRDVRGRRRDRAPQRARRRERHVGHRGAGGRPVAAEDARRRRSPRVAS